ELPVFRWKPLAGATQYVVSIFDDRFNPVAASGALSEAEWKPEQPLARDRIYNWQVSATAGGRTVNAPVPPAPEARFQVVAPEIAREIESARREHPGNHLLLAVLYSKAG